MIYHGSIKSGLKEIIPNASTQKGKYVYGTKNIIYAAIFAIIKNTDKPFPPKFGIKPGNIYLAEKFENQFESLKNIRISIYVLDDKEFYSFDNHSAGDDVELRAIGVQKVKQEIVIDNAMNYLIENGVTFYKYKDRGKVGIPNSDKYFVQGILKTYFWKIEDRNDDSLRIGDEFLEDIKSKFSKYNELLDRFVAMIKVLSNDRVDYFIKNLYDYKKDDFNYKVIQEMEEDIKLKRGLV